MRDKGKRPLIEADEAPPPVIEEEAGPSNCQNPRDDNEAEPSGAAAATAGYSTAAISNPPAVPTREDESWKRYRGVKHSPPPPNGRPTYTCHLSRADSPHRNHKIWMGRFYVPRAAALAYDIFAYYNFEDDELNFPENIQLYAAQVPRRRLDAAGDLAPIRDEDLQALRLLAVNLIETLLPNSCAGTVRGAPRRLAARGAHVPSPAAPVGPPVAPPITPVILPVTMPASLSLSPPYAIPLEPRPPTSLYYTYPPGYASLVRPQRPATWTNAGAPRSVGTPSFEVLTPEPPSGEGVWRRSSSRTPPEQLSNLGSQGTRHVGSASLGVVPEPQPRTEEDYFIEMTPPPPRPRASSSAPRGAGCRVEVPRITQFGENIGLSRLTHADYLSIMRALERDFTGMTPPPPRPPANRRPPPDAGTSSQARPAPEAVPASSEAFSKRLLDFQAGGSVRATPPAITTWAERGPTATALSDPARDDIIGPDSFRPPSPHVHFKKKWLKEAEQVLVPTCRREELERSWWEQLNRMQAASRMEEHELARGCRLMREETIERIREIMGELQEERRQEARHRTRTEYPLTLREASSGAAMAAAPLGAAMAAASADHRISPSRSPPRQQRSVSPTVSRQQLSHSPTVSRGEDVWMVGSTSQDTTSNDHNTSNSSSHDINTSTSFALGLLPTLQAGTPPYSRPHHGFPAARRTPLPNVPYMDYLLRDEPLRLSTPGPSSILPRASPSHVRHEDLVGALSLAMQNITQFSGSYDRLGDDQELISEDQLVPMTETLTRFPLVDTILRLGQPPNYQESTSTSSQPSFRIEEQRPEMANLHAIPQRTERDDERRPSPSRLPQDPNQIRTMSEHQKDQEQDGEK